MVERRAICVIFPAGRCYVALEELRWGAFGDVYVRAKQARLTSYWIFSDIKLNADGTGEWR